METLRWRQNVRDSVSNHQPYDCLLNRLFRRRSKKISKLRVTGLCAGCSPGTGEFPAQMPSNAENVSIWWRLHDLEMHLSQIWKKKIIMKQFHTGKFIWIYHLERGTILSRPQSIAAETFQISPEVRNAIENVVFKIEVTLSLPQRINTSRQRHGRCFADHDFKFIFKYHNCICKSKTNSKIYIKMSFAK